MRFKQNYGIQIHWTFRRIKRQGADFDTLFLYLIILWCPRPKFELSRYASVRYLNRLKPGTQRLYSESSILLQFNVTKIRSWASNGITISDDAAIYNQRVVPIGFGISMCGADTKNITGDSAIWE